MPSFYLKTRHGINGLNNPRLLALDSGFAAFTLSSIERRPHSNAVGGGISNQNPSQDSPKNGPKWEGSIDSGCLAHPI